MLKPLAVLLPIIFISSMAEARSYNNYRTVHGSVSIVDVDHFGTTVGLGVGADFGMAERIILSGTVDYWSESETVYGYRWSVRDFVIGGFGKYMFEINSPKITPFAGIGLALHMFEAEWDGHPYYPYYYNGRYDDDETEIGVDIGGGIHYEIDTDLSLGGMLKFRSVSDTDLDQFAITGFVAHSF